MTPGWSDCTTAADPGGVPGADVVAALKDLHDILAEAGSEWETS